MADVVEQVREISTRVAAGYGLEVFDVQFRREAPGMVLRVQIDRPGPAASAEESVSVEDCANVSRDLSAILDVEDVLPGAYTLEVSSPGLDRPLRGAADYERFVGRRAKIVTSEQVDGQTFLRGTLAGVDGNAALVDGDDHKRHRVPMDVIRRANLEVDF
ncbi:MAG TPA: ribosome maturation factor RimP [Vicinamibacterales bacterium]|jgi:ribosome maturation factor RimP